MKAVTIEIKFNRIETRCRRLRELIGGVTCPSQRRHIQRTLDKLRWKRASLRAEMAKQVHKMKDKFIKETQKFLERGNA